MRDGRPALEDVWVAGLLSAGLPGRCSDSAVIAEARARSGPPGRVIGSGSHAFTLRDEELAAELECCLQVSTLDCVPEVIAAEPFRAEAFAVVLARRAGVTATAALEYGAVR